MVNIIIRSHASRQRFWPSWRRWTGSQYVLGQYLVMWYEEALFNHGCQIKQVSDPYDHPRSSSSSSSTLRSATWWTSWFLGSATTGQIPCGKDCNCWGTSRLRYILKYLQNYENIQIFENISSFIKKTGMRVSRWSACVESSTSYQLSGHYYKMMLIIKMRWW